MKCIVRVARERAAQRGERVRDRTRRERPLVRAVRREAARDGLDVHGVDRARVREHDVADGDLVGEPVDRAHEATGSARSNVTTTSRRRMRQPSAVRTSASR
jgi:hypothetical protein